MFAKYCNEYICVLCLSVCPRRQKVHLAFKYLQLIQRLFIAGLVTRVTK